jgi:hypothetical protein
MVASMALKWQALLAHQTCLHVCAQASCQQVWCEQVWCQKASAFALDEGLHQGAGIVRLPGDQDQRDDRQEEGHHQEDLAGHNAACQRLQADLIGIERATSSGKRTS